MPCDFIWPYVLEIMGVKADWKVAFIETVAIRINLKNFGVDTGMEKNEHYSSYVLLLIPCNKCNLETRVYPHLF